MVCSINNRTTCLGLNVCMCVPTSVCLFCLHTRPSCENGCGSTRAERLCWMGLSELFLMKWSIEKFEFLKIRTYRRQPIVEPRVRLRFVWVSKQSESNCRIARIDSYLAFYTCMHLCRYYSIGGFDCVKAANMSTSLACGCTLLLTRGVSVWLVSSVNISLSWWTWKTVTWAGTADISHIQVILFLISLHSSSSNFDDVVKAIPDLSASLVTVER